MIDLIAMTSTYVSMYQLYTVAFLDKQKWWSTEFANKTNGRKLHMYWKSCYDGP